MTDANRVRQSLLKAAYAHTKSLSLVRELKRIYDERKSSLPLALK